MSEDFHHCSVIIACSCLNRFDLRQSIDGQSENFDKFCSEYSVGSILHLWTCGVSLFLIWAITNLKLKGQTINIVVIE